MNYVIISAARNEKAFIEHTLRSVVAQTQLPERWVIVDDGSTDETPEIIARYAKDHPWIDLVRRPQRVDRSFAGKAHAVNAGLERVKGVGFEVVVNLDADVLDGERMAERQPVAGFFRTGHRCDLRHRARIALLQRAVLQPREDLGAHLDAT